MSDAPNQLPSMTARDALSRWDNEGGALQSPDRTQSLRILIVAGDPLISLPLAVALGDLGHEVRFIALSNDQAARLGTASPPDLIIADAYLEDDERLTATAPVMRALFVPRLFDFGVSLRPGAMVLRRPFRTNDLRRAIRQTMEKAVRWRSSSPGRT